MRKLLFPFFLLLALLSAYGMFYFHHFRQVSCKVGTETNSGIVAGKFNTLTRTQSRDFMGRCIHSIIYTIEDPATRVIRVERAVGRARPNNGGLDVISKEVKSY